MDGGMTVPPIDWIVKRLRNVLVVTFGGASVSHGTNSEYLRRMCAEPANGGADEILHNGS
jgi:hypothetical protein